LTNPNDCYICCLVYQEGPPGELKLTTRFHIKGGWSKPDWISGAVTDLIRPGSAIKINSVNVADIETYLLRKIVKLEEESTKKAAKLVTIEKVTVTCTKDEPTLYLTASFDFYLHEEK
jgi:hypothetical protein